MSTYENAREGAGADVTQLGGEVTHQGRQAQSSTDVLKSKSTSAEIQRAKILALLRNGAKTTIDLRAHGCLMPSTRIFELKKAGYDIQTELVQLFDEHGFRHTKCARYHLVREAAERPVAEA